MTDEREMRERLQRLELLVGQVDKNVSRLLRVVLGDGDARALVTRVDRLEQFMGRAKWLGGALIVAILALIGDALKGLFGQRG